LDRVVSLGNNAKRLAAVAAVTALATLVATNSGYAQSNVTGSLTGDVNAGSTVTAVQVDTGYTRTVTANASGSFTMTNLPTGRYKVTSTDPAEETMVIVGLASTATANFGDGVVVLDEFSVSGMSFNPIDFGRTESVTVFNAQQLKTLPVARNTTDVALMAPGTVTGDPGFGNLASFGGRPSLRTPTSSTALT
jgi:hypothetical protein